MSRVALYLKKTLSSADCRIAQFGQCIVDFFEFGDVGFGHVGLIHDKNRLILYGVDSATRDEEGVLLRHAWLCPVHQWEAEDLQNTSQEIRDKGVGVGVAILLTSSDNHVLVTRRADHMRTFPGVWVPPGGHVEIGESLKAAGLRELQEETGLELGLDVPSTILGLWESVYPHSLVFGKPVRQHIVIYLAIRSELTWRQLAQKIKLDPKETDAALWLPIPLVEKIATGISGEEAPEHVSVFLRNTDGIPEEVEIETRPIIEQAAPPPGATVMEVERLTWGTRFALQRWVKWVQGTATGFSKL